MFKTTLLVLLLLSSLDAKEYRVLYNLTTDKEKNFEAAILQGIPNLKKYYASQGDTLVVAVVISGGSYGFFKKENTKDREALESLEKSGAKFEVCSVGMAKRKIPADAMFPFVKLAFNKTAALIEWQSRGYALIDVE
ncbi:MAG: DsrE family protein [Sulfurimonas sp.]|nr:DsrE family protein [Sulfurimonas sp.]